MSTPVPTMRSLGELLDGAALALVRYTALGAYLAAKDALVETAQPGLVRLREDAAAKLFEVAEAVGDDGRLMADWLSRGRGLSAARLAQGIQLAREEDVTSQAAAARRTLLSLLADDLALAGAQVGEWAELSCAGEAEQGRGAPAPDARPMPALATQLERTALALVQLAGLYHRMNTGTAPTRQGIRDDLKTHRKATLSALADLGAIVGPAELPLGIQSEPDPAAMWLVRGGHITRGALADVHDRIDSGTAERSQLQDLAEDLALCAARLREWQKLVEQTTAEGPGVLAGRAEKGGAS